MSKGMTLEEAIEWLGGLREEYLAESPIKEYSQAAQLGIEALERIKTVREDWLCPRPQPVIDIIGEATEPLPSEEE